MTGEMLVGFDASEESYKAFDFALDMASSCKLASGISVLTVIQPPEGLYLVEADNLLNETTKQYQTLLKDLEERARAKNIGISTEIAVGHPAETIVKAAKKKGCPMIIVGHKGRSKLEGLFLGSVSRNVAAMAQCTVIIVRKD